ncbi:hypothetical protein QNM97_18580 [Gordonia sp. L191]|uniref:hypothetical protein n=1 Tax=Gordonia sp. L191 TaxID=2982699 RepID=UPI0024C0A3EC|nr:hypothetical protein [Gordonia sp. L191]WHU45996.1 hypothetical protein QNM97_18580 [Gordonia sp. L191]
MRRRLTTPGTSDKRIQKALTRSGLTADELDVGLRRLHGDALVPRDTFLTATQRIAAVVANTGGQPIVSATAATILHGSRWYEADFAIELIRHPTGCNRGTGLTQITRTDLTDDDIVDVDGVLVTSPVRTAFDIGRVAPDWRALGYLCALARATDFSVAELGRYVDDRPGRRGVCQLREMLPYINPAFESPPEAWLFLIAVRGQLPTPDIQIEVSDADGIVYARIDLGYEELKIGIEYDGEEFHSTPDQVAYGERRRRMLEAAGWIMIYIDKVRLRDPMGIIREIAAALHARGAY